MNTTVEFYLDSRIGSKLYKGTVQYRAQLGFISIIDGVRFELSKVIFANDTHYKHQKFID